MSEAMFIMQSSFRLNADISISAFQQSLGGFAEAMRKLNLIHEMGPIYRRRSDTPMDTGSSTDHEYIFATLFTRKKQCDDAYDFINQVGEPFASIHHAVVSKVRDPLFSCWEPLT